MFSTCCLMLYNGAPCCFLTIINGCSHRCPAAASPSLVSPVHRPDHRFRPQFYYRYPNPMSTHVLSVDTLSRYVHNVFPISRRHSTNSTLANYIYTHQNHPLLPPTNHSNLSLDPSILGFPLCRCGLVLLVFPVEYKAHILL